MAKEVAKKEDAGLPAELMDDMFDNAGEGAVYGQDELMIPFVRLAQSLSPQINPKKPEHIEGLTVGDAYNNVTSEFWEGAKGIVVVPAYQTTKFLEFVPRKQGGGFVGEIDPGDSRLLHTTRDGGIESLENGNDVVKTDQHFVLIVDEKTGAVQPAVIDMKSTQLKVSRRWKTQIAMKKIRNPKTGKMVTPPLYASMWRLRAVEETNDKGDFYNWSVESVGLVTDRDLYEEAKAFRESAVAGAVKAVPDEHPEPEDRGGSAPVGDDEIPF